MCFGIRIRAVFIKAIPLTPYLLTTETMMGEKLTKNTVGDERAPSVKPLLWVFLPATFCWFAVSCIHADNRQWHKKTSPQKQSEMEGPLLLNLCCEILYLQHNSLMIFCGSLTLCDDFVFWWQQWWWQTMVVSHTSITYMWWQQTTTIKN